MFKSKRTRPATGTGTGTEPHAGPAGTGAPGAPKYRKNSIRADIIAAMGEFVGTFVFLLLGLAGIQAAADASPSRDAAYLLMAATSMAVAITFAAFTFFRVTGAAFNPNVALALLLAGAISPIRFVLYVIAQFLGAIAASAVLLGILPGPLRVLCERGNGIGIAQALFFEMFLTAALCLVVLMVNVEKNKTTILFPLALGFTLWATHLAALRYTGSAVNTARAFGPAVVVGDFLGSHWIYWVGPSLGAIIAAILYRLLVILHYWEIVPDATATSAQEAANQTTEPSRATVAGNTNTKLESRNQTSMV